MTAQQSWQQRLARLKFDTYALYLASKDPRVPWYLKALIALVVGYLFSPIDLIPDFIPFLGYLDDLILAPLAIGLIFRLLPDHLLAEYRQTARQHFDSEISAHWSAGLIVVLIWLGLLALLGLLILN